MSLATNLTQSCRYPSHTNTNLSSAFDVESYLRNLPPAPRSRTNPLRSTRCRILFGLRSPLGLLWPTRLSLLGLCIILLFFSLLLLLGGVLLLLLVAFFGLYGLAVRILLEGLIFLAFILFLLVFCLNLVVLPLLAILLLGLVGPSVGGAIGLLFDVEFGSFLYDIVAGSLDMDGGVFGFGVLLDLIAAL